MLGNNGLKRSKVSILFLMALCGLVLVSIRSMFIPNIYASRKDEPLVCLRQLLVAAIEVAKRGGDKVREVREKYSMHVKSKGKTAEGVMDPITEGDILSHEQMYFGLLKMWPEIDIVSEERSISEPAPEEIEPINLNTDEISKKLASNLHKDVRMQDVTIWIDPLDATREYTQDLMEYVTTMVCVAHKGEPVIGVIHRPFQEETIWAWKGHGRSDIPNFNKNIESGHDKQLKIIVSLSHAGKVKKLANDVFGSKIEIISAGGAGYKSLTVAQRNVDAYIHTTAIKKWDICAGNALLKTVGGKMTDLKGQEIDYSFPIYMKSGVKVNNGLLATYKDHSNFLRKLKNKKRDVHV